MELRVCQSCNQIRASGTSCGTCHAPLQLTDGSLLLGQTLGKYRIDSVLGAGGMGVVFRATHVTLERPAALKIVVPVVGEEGFARRFLREARILAELKHPSIVDIYDFDVSTWGVPYYVMELLDGATLGELGKEHASGMAPELLSSVLADVASGLAFAHQKGVVHRDLKPENVFVARYHDRAVGKVLDFGIAKIVAQGRETSRLTMTGTLVGTPYYLAPEQLLGAEIGPAVDQYALALITAEMLSGRAVREGKTLGQIFAVDIQQPLPAAELHPGLPPSVAAAIERATQPAAADRFPGVVAFVEALELPAGDQKRLALSLTGRGRAKAPPAGDGAGPWPATATPAASGAPPGISPPRPGDAAVPPTERLVTPARVDLPERPSVDAWRSMAPPSGEGPASPVPSAAAAVTAAAREHHPVAPARRGLMAAAWVVVVIVLGAVGRVWIPRDRPSLPGAGGPAVDAATPPATPARPATGISRVRDIHAPVDASRILAVRSDAYVLQGASGLHLLPAEGSAPATPLPFPGRIVGGAPEGRIDVVRDGVLLRSDIEGKAVLTLASPVPAPAAEAAARLWVSPEGRWLGVAGEDGKLDVFRLDGGRAVPAFAVPGANAEAFVVLGDRTLALVVPTSSVTAYRLEDGRKIHGSPFSEQRVFSIALHEDADQLAVAGWFDRVLLYDLSRPDPPRAIPRHGPTYAVALLPDHPTVLAAGERGMAAVRAGFQALAASLDDRAYRDLQVLDGRIVALDTVSHVLTEIAYDDGAGVDPRKVSDQPIWALAEDPVRRMVLVGGRDGMLYCTRLDGGDVYEHPLHTDGITSMARHGGHLATASDDKTIAVWKLSDMSVLWRSKAHGFLVNYLRVQGEPPSLWSSSSDGALKQWDFPQLEERRTIATRDVVGEARALAAFWVSPAQDRVVAGAWGHALLQFSLRPDGSWAGQSSPMVSRGIYQIVDMPAVEALLLLGVQPATLAVLDLRDGTLHRVRRAGQQVAFAEAMPGGSGAWVTCAGALLAYAFSREPSGSLAYEARCFVRTDLGTVGAAALVDGGRRLAVGNDVGELRILAPDLASRPVLVHDVLPAPAPPRGGAG